MISFVPFFCFAVHILDRVISPPPSSFLSPNSDLVVPFPVPHIPAMMHPSPSVPMPRLMACGGGGGAPDNLKMRGKIIIKQKRELPCK